jgi:hypothetical protein
VEDEQGGSAKAAYGKAVLKTFPGSLRWNLGPTSMKVTLATSDNST